MAATATSPDRIDFSVINDRIVMVQKFERCPADRRDRAISAEKKPADFDLDTALAWCEHNGYTVHRWHDGARAWKGEPWPIRTGNAILRKRALVERQTASFIRRHPRKPAPNLSSLNLAYDG